jgi:hypothetical protein
LRAAGKTGSSRVAKARVTQALAHLHPLDGAAGAVDLPAAEQAASDLLVALGVDLAGESLRDTPRRMARM